MSRKKSPQMKKRTKLSPQVKPTSQISPDLEREHRAWLARRNYTYISLREAARFWGRTPEEIIQWERLLDQRGFYPPIQRQQDM